MRTSRLATRINQPNPNMLGGHIACYLAFMSCFWQDLTKPHLSFSSFPFSASHQCIVFVILCQSICLTVTLCLSVCLSPTVYLSPSVFGCPCPSMVVLCKNFTFQLKVVQDVRKTDRLTYRQTDTQKNISCSECQKDRKADQQTNRPTDRNIDRGNDRGQQ